MPYKRHTFFWSHYKIWGYRKWWTEWSVIVAGTEGWFSLLIYDSRNPTVVDRSQTQNILVNIPKFSNFLCQSSCLTWYKWSLKHHYPHLTLYWRSCFLVKFIFCGQTHVQLNQTHSNVLREDVPIKRHSLMFNLFSLMQEHRWRNLKNNVIFTTFSLQDVHMVRYRMQLKTLDYTKHFHK